MLKSLRIKNYAIIDDLSIEFEKGFNVFTGETGAGKSIIVGALSLLLKGRSDSSVVKANEEKAIIEGVFEIDDPDLAKKLDEQDIEYDGEIIVKRVISKDNKNSIKINQSSVTLNFLNELLADYVDIHSQKDSQYLFNKNNQLYTLDRYADNEDLLNEYHSLYSAYKKVAKEYNELLNNTYNEREIELITYDYKELDEANLSLDEEDELLSLEKRSKSSEKYLSVLNNAISLYDEDAGVKEKLYDLINELDIDDDKISLIKENLNSLYYSLDENMDELKDILNSFDNEELDLDRIQERLYLYGKLKRKHKTDTEGLIALKAKLKADLDLFNDRDTVLADKQKELDKAFKSAKDKADEIHKRRIDAAKELEKEIKQETDDLLLPNCNFKIIFNEADLNGKGYDDVEFYVSLNKGEEPKPLKNVASGGEISRLMLSLKVAFAKISKTDLLILDEIDTGVSGKVALAVGQKIAKIGKAIQVLCISHLAPVAACANHHLLIYKQDNETSSITHVRPLENEEIIKELASISNTSTNEKALEAAKELYDDCQNKIKNL
ncbi:MAG: DNA repair protein RecN [Erysipelotrichaceae bacterium]|nr:DNA repair protein RecN [Erysipelotrichaceae bacterium]